MPEETTTDRSVLAQVRALVPPRPLTPTESRQVIERQATRLLKLMTIPGPPVPIEQILTELPRVEIRRTPGLRSSGRTDWAGNRWIILVAEDEAHVRQRYSMGHELAHVIYHPLATLALAATDTTDASTRLEKSCEYFAACLLVPRVWIKQPYFEDRIQDVPSLARLFGVSWAAMRIRLEQLGLVPTTNPRRSS